MGLAVSGRLLWYRRVSELWSLAGRDMAGSVAVSCTRMGTGIRIMRSRRVLAMGACLWTRSCRGRWILVVWTWLDVPFVRGHGSVVSWSTVAVRGRPLVLVDSCARALSLRDLLALPCCTPAWSSKSRALSWGFWASAILWSVCDCAVGRLLAAGLDCVCCTSLRLRLMDCHPGSRWRLRFGGLLVSPRLSVDDARPFVRVMCVLRVPVRSCCWS